MQHHWLSFIRTTVLGFAVVVSADAFDVAVHCNDSSSAWLSLSVLKGRKTDKPWRQLLGTISPKKRRIISTAPGVQLIVSSGALEFNFSMQETGAVTCDVKEAELQCDVHRGPGVRNDDLDRYVGLCVFGESTYAGERDLRFLNCLAPCELTCEKQELPNISVESFLKISDLNGRADLLPFGHVAYTKNLTLILQQSYDPEFISSHRSCSTKLGDAVLTHCLPSGLRLLGWNCAENCRYECMAQNRITRRENSEQTVHYYGKWPFLRVLGIQELLSSAFSLLNGAPHFWFLASGSPWKHPCKGQRDTHLWTAFAAVHVNTWLQSALFHARDTPLFETLDYYSATLGLAMHLACAIAFNLPESWSMPRAMAAAFTPIFLGWAALISYQSFVSFDYEGNMMVAVSLGVGAGVAWLTWFVRHLEECRNFAWKVLVAILLPLLALPFELLDFPPIGDLLDAHAIWHLGTVPMQFLTYHIVLLRMREAAAHKKAAKIE